MPWTHARVFRVFVAGSLLAGVAACGTKAPLEGATNPGVETQRADEEPILDPQPGKEVPPDAGPKSASGPTPSIPVTDVSSGAQTAEVEAGFVIVEKTVDEQGKPTLILEKSTNDIVYKLITWEGHGGAYKESVWVRGTATAHTDHREDRKGLIIDVYKTPRPDARKYKTFMDHASAEDFAQFTRTVTTSGFKKIREYVLKGSKFELHSETKRKLRWQH